MTQDVHAHPNAAGAEEPVYVSMVKMDLRAPTPWKTCLPMKDQE